MFQIYNQVIFIFNNQLIGIQNLVAYLKFEGKDLVLNMDHLEKESKLAKLSAK